MMDGMEDQESDDCHMCNVCNEEIVGGDLEEDEVLALVMKKTLLAPKKEDEEEWLMRNIFYTTCNIGGRVCSLVIDGGSCENVIS